MSTHWQEQYLAAWNTRDGRQVAEWMTRDCVYEDLTLGESHKGPADIAAFVDGVAPTFSDDYSFTLLDGASTADHYYMEWVMRGTHNGTAGPLPPTGKSFEIRGVSVGELEDGRICANRDYWDMATFLTQVGLMPGPTPDAPNELPLST
jgi:steroid delta-isomerase-like uncharacterized protein